MAGRKNKTPKEPTVKTAPPQKKKRGKEKKPTINVGAPPLREEDKPTARPIALKKPKKTKRESDARKNEQTQVPPEISEQPKVEQPKIEQPKEQPAAPKRTLKPIFVTFVCTGNTCRSAMAQYIFRDYLKRRGEEDAFDVRSAGLAAQTGSDMSDNAYAALKEMNIKVAMHFSQQLTWADVDESDIIVCMSESHKRAIGGLKAVTLGMLDGGGEVPDPYGQPLEAYRATARRLLNACPQVYAAALDAVK